MPPLKQRPADNFRLLDPDAPRTKRTIEAMLSANSPLPWEPERGGPSLEKSALAALADRIAARARKGKTVHLTPRTADVVADALYTVANGPVTSEEVDRTFAHRLLDESAGGRPDVIAYARDVDLVHGAMDRAVEKKPLGRFRALWSGWTTRKHPPEKRERR